MPYTFTSPRIACNIQRSKFYSLLAWTKPLAILFSSLIYCFFFTSLFVNFAFCTTVRCSFPFQRLTSPQRLCQLLLGSCCLLHQFLFHTIFHRSVYFSGAPVYCRNVCVCVTASRVLRWHVTCNGGSRGVLYWCTALLAALMVM